MALFSSVLRQFFERFAQFLRRRETPLKTQPCVAQEQVALEKPPEASVMKTGESEAFNITAKNKKRRRRRHQYGEKEKERQFKRKVKKEREVNDGGSHKEKAEKERETLSLQKVKGRGHVPEKKRDSAKSREMQSLEDVTEGEGEPNPLLVEAKPLLILVRPSVRSSLLKPIEGELPVLSSVCEDHLLPAAHFRPLPLMTKPPMYPQNTDPAPEEVSLPCSLLTVDPLQPLAVPPHPTPAAEELFSLRLSQVSPPKQLEVPPSPAPDYDEVVDLQHTSTEVCPFSPVEPQPSTSFLFEPPSQLMLIDLEDEETECVKYTGKTYQAWGLHKSESPRPLEAEIKPRKIIAWLESDSEELEEVCPSEVVEVQECEEEKDNPEEMGDSSAMEGHLDDTSQKKEDLDEHMRKLFCVTSPEGPKNETQQTVNVQEEPQSKKKVPSFLFTWAEKKAKKKEQKKIRKEKERREKELLLDRYRNDPKLKHLLFNKHNRHYCSE